MTKFTHLGAAGLAFVATSLLSAPALADIIHGDDVIINNSVAGGTTGQLCVGSDCVSGETLGADTLRLKQNNVRIHFEDTSVVPGTFPSNDWRILINDSFDGGACRPLKSLCRQSARPNPQGRSI